MHKFGSEWDWKWLIGCTLKRILKQFIWKWQETGQSGGSVLASRNDLGAELRFCAFQKLFLVYRWDLRLKLSFSLRKLIAPCAEIMKHFTAYLGFLKFARLRLYNQKLSSFLKLLSLKRSAVVEECKHSHNALKCVGTSQFSRVGLFWRSTGPVFKQSKKY